VRGKLTIVSLRRRLRLFAGSLPALVVWDMRLTQESYHSFGTELGGRVKICAGNDAKEEPGHAIRVMPKL
jgi:hypothetical protein